MVVRSAMHQAGATALTKLLELAAPDTGQRTIPCTCGHAAQYRELRSKPVLSVVGMVEVSRPYYLCPHCHTGQFPTATNLNIENTKSSPEFPAWKPAVGQGSPFDNEGGRINLLMAWR